MEWHGHCLDVFVVVQSLTLVWLFVTTWTAARQASPSFTISGACSNLCPLNQWCHPTISSSVIPSSSRLQSFPASGSFPMSQLFAASSQRIGASASVFPMNIQGWFPLGLTCWISLQSKGLSRVSPAPQFESIDLSSLSLFYGQVASFISYKPPRDAILP